VANNATELISKATKQNRVKLFIGASSHVSLTVASVL
jgi:hypothetical protein